MRKAMVITAIFLLFGCKPGTDKAIQLAQNEMSASMKDPDSAKFRYMRFIKSGEMDDGTISGIVCGQINGKNGYGAYAGFTPFSINISMKEKGFFSKGVDYTIKGKQYLSEPSPQEVTEYHNICGADE